MIRAATAILTVILLWAASDSAAATLYVRRVLIADRGALTVGSIVQTSGEVSPEIRETLDRSIGELGDAILLVSSGAYKDLFDLKSGENLIFVGSRTLVAPRGLVAENAVSLLDKLADYIEGQGLVGPGKTELEIVQITGLPKESGVESPAFKTIRVEKKAGLASGTAEFSFQGSSQDADFAAGRIVLRISLDSSSRDSSKGAQGEDGMGGVRANEAVCVLFRKGSIVVEMNGKALASAREGERVSVFIPESRKSFSGVVMANKAVSVELN
jgi:hypothetical protein